MFAAQPDFALATILSMPPVVHSPEFAGVDTIDQFGALVIGRADLSRAASRLAVEDACRADVKEFAGYELMEAETVVAVLEGLGTLVPPMDGEAWATLSQIINTPVGGVFDAAYMTTQYENHVFLRDLAAAYLRSPNTNTADSRERYGRQLASVALFTFAQHTDIAQRILRKLAA